MTKFEVDSNLYNPIENNVWGFNNYSERLNGRIAMIGFMVLFIFELLTKQKIIDFLK